MPRKDESETRECPFCKELIKSDAIICKHCHSKVAQLRPEHGGVCPFCKENVKPEAVVCKHCGSQIGENVDAIINPCFSHSHENVALMKGLISSKGDFPNDYDMCYLRCYMDTRRAGGSHDWAQVFCDLYCKDQHKWPLQRMGW